MREGERETGRGGDWETGDQEERSAMSGDPGSEEQQMSENVLVTGGAGFSGFYLVNGIEQARQEAASRGWTA